LQDPQRSPGKGNFGFLEIGDIERLRTQILSIPIAVAQPEGVVIVERDPSNSGTRFGPNVVIPDVDTLRILTFGAVPANRNIVKSFSFTNIAGYVRARLQAEALATSVRSAAEESRFGSIPDEALLDSLFV
jgi:hypothetical protein